MDSAHARTNAHTGTRTANKSKGKRGAKGRRALAHDEKTPPKKQERKIIVFIEGLATLHASSLIDFQSKVSN